MQPALSARWLRAGVVPADDGVVANDALPQGGSGSASGRPRGFLRRNLFAIWGLLMLVGGVARLLVHRDGSGFVGVGLGIACLLTDGVSRQTRALVGRQSKK